MSVFCKEVWHFSVVMCVATQYGHVLMCGAVQRGHVRLSGQSTANRIHCSCVCAVCSFISAWQ
jgi:hypothetical protein